MAQRQEVIFLLLLFGTVTADDEAVMTALLSGLSSPPSGWSESTPCCEWTGVECDASNRVTSLNLDYMFLPGTLPAQLNNLSELKFLSLRHNSFSGAFPSLSGLASLQKAFFDGNRFNSAPSGFLSGLTSLLALSLTDNPNLPPWSFPTDLTESRSLVSLYASDASLTGSLPDMFGSLSNLQDLDLSCNNLSGHIPRTLMTLTNLRSLDLSNNNFSGTLPESAFTKVKKLHLANNPFLFQKDSSLSYGLAAGMFGLSIAACIAGISYKVFKIYKEGCPEC